MAALIGDPARYSLSPAIHNAAYAAMGENLVYVVLPVKTEHVGEAIAATRIFDIVGVSVTIPHKESVIAYLDLLSDDAKRLNAVNTIVNRDGALEGHNTDGAGFVRALEVNGFKVKNAKCVVIGAGGSARAVIAGLTNADAAEIVVINRSAERAEQAAASSAITRVGTVGDIPGADLIVNATPIGMGDTPADTPIDTSRLTSGHFVADLVYHPAETRLLAEAKARGAKTMNGLSMLVYQASIQIELWTGKTPPIDVMFRAIE